MQLRMPLAGFRKLVYDLTRNDIDAPWPKLRVFRYSQSDTWYVELSRSQARTLRSISDKAALQERYGNEKL